MRSDHPAGAVVERAAVSDRIRIGTQQVFAGVENSLGGTVFLKYTAPKSMPGCVD